MIVDTNSLICENVGLSILKRSTAILFKAVLSEREIYGVSEQNLPTTQGNV